MENEISIIKIITQKRYVTGKSKKIPIRNFTTST